MHLAVVSGCVCMCVSSTQLHRRKRLFRKEEKDDTRVQGDSYIYMITMEIVWKGIPTPRRAGMMTAEYRTCVIALYAFFLNEICMCGIPLASKDP